MGSLLQLRRSPKGLGYPLVRYKILYRGDECFLSSIELTRYLSIVGVWEQPGSCGQHGRKMIEGVIHHVTLLLWGCTPTPNYLKGRCDMNYLRPRKRKQSYESWERNVRAGLLHRDAIKCVATERTLSVWWKYGIPISKVIRRLNERWQYKREVQHESRVRVHQDFS